MSCEKFTRTVRSFHSRSRLGAFSTSVLRVRSFVLTFIYIFSVDSLAFTQIQKILPCVLIIVISFSLFFSHFHGAARFVARSLMRILISIHSYQLVQFIRILFLFFIIRIFGTPKVHTKYSVASDVCEFSNALIKKMR